MSVMQFNARCETVAEKSVFGRLLQRQRCVVLFDGFYEWKKVSVLPVCSAESMPDMFQRQISATHISTDVQEGPRKQPFYVNTGEGNIMKMAGLFDVWFSSTDDAPLYTYTILTTDSSKRLEWYAYVDVAATVISVSASL